jgi:hypothetical protein
MRLCSNGQPSIYHRALNHKNTKVHEGQDFKVSLVNLVSFVV